MAVRAELGLRRGVEEIEPVPERRQRIADPGIGIVLVERGDQGAHREGGGKILDGVRAADPFAQLFQRHRWVPPFESRVWHRERGVERPRRHRYIPARRAQTGAAMTTFDEREKSFEKKFEHDQELQFRANTRKNKLLGLWAAGLMGKSGADAEAYAKEVVMAEFEKPGDSDIMHKLMRDLAAAGKPTDELAIRKQAERLLLEAKKQVMTETKA